MVSKHLSSCNLHQFKNVTEDLSSCLVMHTRQNTKAMASKLFLDNILLLEMYSFKGFSNRYKNDGMVSNIQIAVITGNFKNLLMLLKIISKIVYDFSHT